MSSKIAIVSYVDNQDKFALEANLMTHSGRFLDDRFEFVIYAHPNIINKITKRKNVKLIEYLYPDEEFFHNYVFGRSMCFINESLTEYDYIVKTDTDVFFTPRMNEFVFDDKIYVGYGHYMHNQDMIDDLTAYAHVLGYTKYTHVGATSPTTFGPSKMVVSLFKDALELNKTLFNLLPAGEWGKTLYKMVSSMYATEIALSNYDFTITNLIDFQSNSSATLDAYHIHCYHTDEIYSKLSQLAGEYDNAKKTTGKTVADYCLNNYIDVRDGLDLI